MKQGEQQKTHDPLAAIHNETGTFEAKDEHGNTLRFEARTNPQGGQTEYILKSTNMTQNWIVTKVSEGDDKTRAASSR